METDYYRSQSDALPTFTLVLAASLVGLSPIAAAAPIPVAGDYVLPASAHYQYYEPAPERAEQVEALKHFAENLLAKTENSPQAVIEIINRHFWELV